MKKLLICLAMLGMAVITTSCSVLKTASDITPNNGLEIGGINFQEIFQENVSDKITSVLEQYAIQAEGVVKEGETNVLHVYENKLVLSLTTDDIRAQLKKDGITTDTITKEKANAATAQMEYTLQYQYGVKLKLNEASKTAICLIDTDEKQLSTPVQITIPISTEDMGTTIYNLLQGMSIRVESCLQHGTACSNTVNTTYYLNELPEGENGTVLTMVDHRTTSE